MNNEKLIFKFNKLDCDNFKISLNKNPCIVNMENYINVLRRILKHFNIRKNNEYDNIIKYIINKIFDEYYNNRHKSKYCIGNLIRKYNIRYFDLQDKYGTVKSTKMIYRFNRYSKRNYIKKLLRNHEYFIQMNIMMKTLIKLLIIYCKCITLKIIKNILKIYI